MRSVIVRSASSVNDEPGASDTRSRTKSCAALRPVVFSTPAAVRRYMGDSVGWWEGDTLVIETTNFNPNGTYIGSLFGDFAYRP